MGVDLLAPKATTTGRKSVRYKLLYSHSYGTAVYHRGVSAAGGHYTLDVLHVARGWVRIDDEPVSDVRAEDVFRVERRGGRVAYWGRYVARLEAPLEELEALVDLRNITSFPDPTSLESSDLTAMCGVCGDEMNYSGCWNGDPDQEEGRERVSA
ncbi:hypothetical protein DFH09DRAFT_1343053 [Mycena vulgaris]|nr:hypothetical protein DFH09DRAFT_1343053 [Mycena vulgaris]